MGNSFSIRVYRNTGVGDTKMRFGYNYTASGNIMSRQAVDVEILANTWYLGYAGSDGKLRINADHLAGYKAWSPPYDASYNWFDKVSGGSSKNIVFGPIPGQAPLLTTDLNDCYLLNRPLTDAEITDIYTQWSARMAGTGPPVDLRKTPLASNVVGMWCFEENGGMLNTYVGTDHAVPSSPSATYEDM